MDSAAVRNMLLHLTKNEYYNVPTDVKGVAGSTGAAEQRGARYALEHRINGLQQQLGQTQPFDPKAEQFVPFTGAEQGNLNHYLDAIQNNNSVLPGATGGSPSLIDPSTPYFDPITQAAGGFIGGHHADMPYSNPYRNADNPAILAQGLQDQSARNSNEEANLYDYLQSRYASDATRAGTLSGTAQSQQALGADVGAGFNGAQQALQNNQNQINQALSPNFASTPGFAPPSTDLSAYTPYTPPAQTPASTAPENVAPENAPAGSNLVSGGAPGSPVGGFRNPSTNGLTPQGRQQAIRNKQS